MTSRWDISSVNNISDNSNKVFQTINKKDANSVEKYHMIDGVTDEAVKIDEVRDSSCEY